jgi:very-short-patch-repair endonuclease
VLLREAVDRRDLRIRNGAPVTSLPRTVVDCLRVLPERDGLTLLDRALQVGWIDMPELTERARDLAGRRGAPRLVRLVRAVADGSRSTAERLLIGVLRSAAIVGWEANARIVDDRGRLLGVADVALRQAKVILEMDGWAFHVDPQRFQHDRHRQNLLVAAGWTVLRFTWRDLTERPGDVIATIVSVLAQRTMAA